MHPSSNSNRYCYLFIIYQVLQFKSFDFDPMSLTAPKEQANPVYTDRNSFQTEHHFSSAIETQQMRGNMVPETGKEVDKRQVNEADRTINENTSSKLIFSRRLEEKRENPERLNLDRRGLNECPILEGEEKLKLLNFQYNNITTISNLENLKNLIFLDFYNNSIKVCADTVLVLYMWQTHYTPFSQSTISIHSILFEC